VRCGERAERAPDGNSLLGRKRHAARFLGTCGRRLLPWIQIRAAKKFNSVHKSVDALVDTNSLIDRIADSGPEVPSTSAIRWQTSTSPLTVSQQ
jgi:hypothetical protein